MSDKVRQPRGVYQSVATHKIKQWEGQDPEGKFSYTDISDADAPHVLGRHVGDAVTRMLTQLKPKQRHDAVNAVLRVVDGLIPAELEQDGVTRAEPDLVEVMQELVEIRDQQKPPLARPLTPLNEAALLTNSREEPKAWSELASEMDSADRVDIIIAFVKHAGVALMTKQLERLQRRGVPVRLLTTTYCGATQRRALDELVRHGVQVKVRYETNSTKLHAKAWLFSRNSGFDTAYVGSSNLSHSAMVDGMEWNVRLSKAQSSAVLTKFRAAFTSYWEGDDFERYDPDRDAHKLDEALAEASGVKKRDVELARLSGIEVEPRPHQKKMLEALEAERTVYGQHDNLIVAATGTGKTVVAALDYRRLCETMSRNGQRPRLLFIAHRREILEQARRMYQEVLVDPEFGEIWGDGQRPIHGDHVFAMIQSLANCKEPLDYDVVVLDESHHGFAHSYREVFSRLSWRELLGMTATPERMDGFNIKDLFGGRIAYELRLWDALDSGLLSPFHYYGIADGTDLSNIGWVNGDYTTSELDDLYTGNEARLRVILNSLNDKVADPSRMRALGFCVSVNHANYMAQMFTRQGIASIAVTGETSRDARAQAFADLRAGKVQCLFSVNVFNEGLDIPKVDVLLMLRPTSSPTVFLQQLGRGLRRAENKDLATVLDFVGNHRAEFDLAKRFEVMIGRKRKALSEEIEDGFPFLPAGTRIVLDEITQKRVLDSVKRTASMGPKGMAALLSSMAVSWPEIGLGDFLSVNGFDLADLYKGKGSWTHILEESGMIPRAPARATLARRMSALVHVDDVARIEAYRRIVLSEASIAEMSVIDRTYAHMLLAVLYRDVRIAQHEECLMQLRSQEALVDEIVQLMELRRQDHTKRVVKQMSIGSVVLPLFTHATYKREELLAALGWIKATKNAPEGRLPSTHHEGVAWIPEIDTDLFLVTLRKHHRHYSPTTMYEDYAVTREIFHWQSQSGTSSYSPTGQRYCRHREMGTHVVLAVRPENVDAVGDGAPYILAGPMDFVSSEGEKPMSIEWRLHRPLSTDLFEESQVISA